MYKVICSNFFKHVFLFLQSLVLNFHLFWFFVYLYLLPRLFCSPLFPLTYLHPQFPFLNVFIPSGFLSQSFLLSPFPTLFYWAVTIFIELWAQNFLFLLFCGGTGRRKESLSVQHHIRFDTRPASDVCVSARDMLPTGSQNLISYFFLHFFPTCRPAHVQTSVVALKSRGIIRRDCTRLGPFRSSRV